MSGRVHDCFHTLPAKLMACYTSAGSMDLCRIKQLQAKMLFRRRPAQVVRARCFPMKTVFCKVLQQTLCYHKFATIETVPSCVHWHPVDFGNIPVIMIWYMSSNAVCHNVSGRWQTPTVGYSSALYTTLRLHCSTPESYQCRTPARWKVLLVISFSAFEKMNYFTTRTDIAVVLLSYAPLLHQAYILQSENAPLL